MKIKQINKPKNLDPDSRISLHFSQFKLLLNELREKEIPKDVLYYINDEIEQVNEVIVTENNLERQLKTSQTKILSRLAKEFKIVPKNHYRNFWMSMGTAAFGLPLGLAISASLDNYAYFGIGLPFGLIMGLTLGGYLDKKAMDQGKQLEVEINY